METKQTPTLWKTGHVITWDISTFPEQSKERYDIHILTDDNGERTIAIIVGEKAELKETVEARAALIVHEHNLQDELVKALKAMTKAYNELIPGIGHIACQDYAIVNEAPILAAAVLDKCEKGE